MKAESAARKNLAMLRTVAEKLGPLRSQVMFMGGTVMPLLLPPELAAEIRPAKDVDILTDFKTKGDLLLFEDGLWEQGFRCESVGAVGHWRIGEIGVDVLCADPDIITFSRIWFREAMRQSQRHVLAKDLHIRIITPVHVLGNKLDAFYRRGRNQHGSSRDMLDLVLILRGCPEIERMIEVQASAALKTYLAEEFKKLLPVVKQVVAQPGAGRRCLKFARQLEPAVIERIRRIAAMDNSPPLRGATGPQELEHVQHRHLSGQSGPS